MGVGLKALFRFLRLQLNLVDVLTPRLNSVQNSAVLAETSLSVSA